MNESVIRGTAGHQWRELAPLTMRVPPDADVVPVVVTGPVAQRGERMERQRLADFDGMFRTVTLPVREGPGEWRAALGIDRLVHIDDDLEAIGAELGRRAMFLGKSARDSEIHRIGKLDVVVVRLHDNEGSHDRLGVFTGLYTAKALHEEVARIPMLREKLARVLEASSAIEGSHLWNGLQQAFRQLPVEFLLEGDAGSVERATRLVFEA